jgi:hypothetical protein
MTVLSLAPPLWRSPLTRSPRFARTPTFPRKRGEVKNLRWINHDRRLHMTTFMESLVWSNDSMKPITTRTVAMGFEELSRGRDAHY